VNKLINAVQGDAQARQVIDWLSHWWLWIVFAVVVVALIPWPRSR